MSECTEIRVGQGATMSCESVHKRHDKMKDVLTHRGLFGIHVEFEEILKITDVFSFFEIVYFNFYTFVFDSFVDGFTFSVEQKEHTEIRVNADDFRSVVLDVFIVTFCDNDFTFSVEIPF